MTTKKPPQNDPNGPDRIAKFLARAGVCSRRDAERLIEEGRVSVDGTILATPAVKVTGTEDIRVDDIRVAGVAATQLWLYHKPAGLVTSHRDEQGRDTIFDHLPPDLPRVVSVGRLDLNSEGLLLLTNDGGLSRHLELPATGWPRCYRVRAFGQITQRGIDALADGLTVEGIHYGPIQTIVSKANGRNIWLDMTLHEGKNREIRRVLNYLGLDVNRLLRLSYGPFELGNLQPGEVREVEHASLKAALGKGFTLS